MTDIPIITLNDKNVMPLVGLGLWKVRDKSEFNIAFNAALASGYRHFDSAQVYGNEHMLGDAWANSVLKRDEFFLTTKIAVGNFGGKRSTTSFMKSLAKLKTGYVDLLLLHFPVSSLRKATWKAAVKLQNDGYVRSIGVSNYTIRHLEEMKKYSDIIPAVNQVELHVFLQQPELVEYCRDRGIVIQAYSPLAHAKDMNEPIIKQIAHKHNKSYAQVMLRWCIEKNLVILPKSTHPKRIKENIDIFDFSLDNEDLQKLGQLDRNLRTCWDPTLIP